MTGSLLLLHAYFPLSPGLGSLRRSVSLRRAPQAQSISIGVPLVGFSGSGTGGAGNSTAICAVGGGENVAMSANNLIQHNHAVFLNDPGHSHTLPGQTMASGAGATSGNVSASLAPAHQQPVLPCATPQRGWHSKPNCERGSKLAYADAHGSAHDCLQLHRAGHLESV
jgi:hypothetical protein